jgi:sugar lactone lactonase YvrE
MSIFGSKEKQVMRRGFKRLMAGGFVLIALMVVNQSTSKTVYAQTSPPRLRTVLPALITAGAPTFTIRCGGRNFEDGAQIVVDGVPLPSTGVFQPGRVGLGHFLLADLDGSVVASPGTHAVSVLNPDGGASTSLVITVVAPDPTVFIRLGGNAAQADPQSPVQISITGEGFSGASQGLIWNHRSPLTTFIDDEDLDIVINQKFLGQPARLPIMVQSGRNSYSNTEIFFVTPVPPKVSSIAPDTVTVGSDAVPIIVEAKNIVAGAQLVVNGQVLSTSVQTTTGGTQKLEATIPPSFFAVPTQLIIRAQQQNIQSDVITLDVTPTDGPYIYAIAPSEVPAGLAINATRRRIKVLGANFHAGTRGLIDGQPPLIKFRGVDKHDLVIRLKADFVATPGTHTFQVMEEDGTVSNVVSFNVVADSQVSTLSGFEHLGYNTECVPSAQAAYQGPRRISLGPDGLLYITDQLSNAVRTLNPTTGELCPLAGTGHLGYNDSGNTAGFPPTLSNPNGVFVGSDGTVYVSENGNNVMRMVQGISTGAITVQTFAGSWFNITNSATQTKFNSTKIGIDGFLDGPATEALMRQPDDIVVASNGIMYFADSGNAAIRQIVQSPNGPIISTIAGNGVPGYFDGIGASAALDTPTGLALSPDGVFLYVADFNNNVIRRINLSTNLVETFAGTSDAGTEDGPALVATFDGPIGLAVDTDGTVYVSELNNSDIRMIDPSGNVTTIAGSATGNLRNGPGVQAHFKHPRGIALDRVNRIIYVADFSDIAIRSVQLATQQPAASVSKLANGAGASASSAAMKERGVKVQP